MRYTIILCALLLLAACSKDPAVEPLLTDLPAVRLTVRPEAAAVLSRAADENEVRDVNFYLVHKGTGRVVHAYAEGDAARLSLLPGDYTAWAAANAGKDLGELSPAALPTLTLPVPQTGEQTVLSMSGVAELSVKGAGNLPPVTVRRNGAKVNLSVRIGPAAQGLELLSVRAVNVPVSVTPFRPEGTLSSSLAEDYRDGEVVEAAGGICQATLYLPENLQGVNRAITDQRQKSRENAPVCATYLRIKTADGGNVYDYDVYLGGNNTSDFNLRGNCVYNLDITVKGTDEVDTRMSSYTVSIRETNAPQFGSYWMSGENIQGNVKVSCSDPARKFLVEIASQNTGFQVNHRKGPLFRFNLPPGGTMSYSVQYVPALVTPQNEELAYEVRVYDEDGYGTVQRFSGRWSNHLFVYTRFNGRKRGGDVLFSGYRDSREGQNDDYDYTELSCDASGFTLRAEPYPGCTFLGWYYDEGCTEGFATEAELHYTPARSLTEVFALFSEPPADVRIHTDIYQCPFTCDNPYTVDYDAEAFVVPVGSRCTVGLNRTGPVFRGWYDTFSAGGSLLGTEDEYTFTATRDCIVMPRFDPVVSLGYDTTANSYIAPATGASYSFRCDKKGNGTQTAGLPAPTWNNIASAAVLWESGSRGSVIRSVGTNQNMIEFTTGESRGNALIGGFDREGRLEWSWHIWAADYDPQATAHSYKGGRVFMDRNLGAMTNRSYEPAYGLMYQWGRKDPFPPDLSAVTYAPGYDYAVVGGRDNGETTLEYAIAHPTYFITGVERENADGPYISDWLAKPNPNLWGNFSSATGQYTAQSAKSVYDPCPPGWRVPDRGAWAEAGFSAYIAGNGGGCMAIRYDGSSVAYYPFAGFIYASTGIKDPMRSTMGYFWTNSPAETASGVSSYDAYGLKVDGGTYFEVDPSEVITRSVGASVRCMRE